jgi:DNA-directed RNA polymerase subunit RPC12/RpoP
MFTATPPLYVDVELCPRPIQVLNDVVPLQERTYNTTCVSCQAKLRFYAEHINSSVGYIWSDLYIDCPICHHVILVGNLVEPWVKRNISRIKDK